MCPRLRPHRPRRARPDGNQDTGQSAAPRATPWPPPPSLEGRANSAELSASLSHPSCKTFCDTLCEGHCINNKLYCIIYQTSSDHKKKHNKPLTIKITNSAIRPGGTLGQCLWARGLCLPQLLPLELYVLVL